MNDEQQVPPEQGTIPTSAADATEEVNQQQAEDQVKLPGEPGGPPSANPHAQGVQPVQPLSVPDERVATSPQNPVVGADQPVSEPAKVGPDQNELQPDVEPQPEPGAEPSH